MLKVWNSLLNSHIHEIHLVTCSLKSMCVAYEKSKKEIVDVGFNIFKLTSDLYYRENFHSDIIKAFLDPMEKHGQCNKYLNIFIDMLDRNLDHDDFAYSNVKKECNNIDILITNSNSRKAIIIENKINNAGDMPRQLPRYFDDIVSKDYEIVAIVYIPLDASKEPDKSTWSDKDKEAINPLLHIIPAYNREGKVNLVDNWIIPSIIESNDIDSSLILRQLGTLIKHLNTSSMDTVILSKFYDSLKENDYLQTAISIRSMLNDLPTYMAIRVEDKYKNSCDPFTKIWRYKNTDTVFEEFKIRDLYFKMDVWCNEGGYDVLLWNPNDEAFDISNYFKDIKILSDFTIYKGEINNIIRHFDVFQEEALFDFINSLLIELRAFKDANI